MAGEEQQESSNPSVEKAQSQGWVPLSDWEAAGKPREEWVDHGEFNYRGELMGRISSQTRELKELRGQTSAYDNKLQKLGKALEMLSEQNKRLAQERLKEERTELRRIRAEAEAEGDHETVASVDEDLDQIKTAEANLASSETSFEEGPEQGGEQQMSPEDAAQFRGWVENNPWYVTNPQAANYANFVAGTIPREGKTFSEYLGDVSEAVSAVFKDEQISKSGSAPGQGVLEPSANGGRGRRSSSSTAVSLTETERTIGQTFVDEGLFKNLDEYAKHLNED